MPSILVTLVTFQRQFEVNHLLKHCADVVVAGGVYGYLFAVLPAAQFSVFSVLASFSLMPASVVRNLV